MERDDGAGDGPVAARSLGPQLELVGDVAHERVPEPHGPLARRLDQAGPLQGPQPAGRPPSAGSGAYVPELHEHPFDEVEGELAGR